MYTENIKIFYRFFTHKNLHYIYERINIQQRWFDLIKKDTSVHNCGRVEYAWLWPVSWDTSWCIVGSMNPTYYTTIHTLWFPAGSSTPASLRHYHPPLSHTNSASDQPWPSASLALGFAIVMAYGIWKKYIFTNSVSLLSILQMFKPLYKQFIWNNETYDTHKSHLKK